jgi:NADH:ubiquinone oxidoreductase subunit 2 (subunit N)
MVDQALLSLAKFLPEITLAITFCVALLAGIMFGSRPKVALWISLLGVVISIAFTIQQMGRRYPFSPG